MTLEQQLAQRVKGVSPSSISEPTVVAAPAPVVPTPARPAAGPVLAAAEPKPVAKPTAVAATVAIPTPAAVAAAAPTPSGAAEAVVLTPAQKTALSQKYPKLSDINKRIRALRAQASLTPVEQAELAYLES